MSRFFGVLGALLLFCISARAHDPKLSRLTIRRTGGELRISAVVAHAKAAGLAGRIALTLSGERVRLTEVRMLPDPAHGSVLLDARLENATPDATIAVADRLFPEEDDSKTLVQLFEGATLQAETVLDAAHPSLSAPSAAQEDRTPTGLALFARFVMEGVGHLFGGPDHLLFLFGLLLLGGGLKRLAKVVTAFTLAHSLTLGLAATKFFSLPSSFVEPIIALSIVSVGVESLTRPKTAEARDFRLPLAFGFGLIHGFGFAGALGELGLPKGATLLALGGFNLGVELGQLALVLLIAPLLALLAKKSPRASRHATIAGATAVIVMGTLWFLQRI